MRTCTRIAALCTLGLSVVACGEQPTQPAVGGEPAISASLVGDTVPGRWVLKPSLLPARMFMGAAVSDKSIVVVGGSVYGGILRRVDAYNVQTNRWTQLASLPEPRVLADATTIHGTIYVAGGETLVTDRTSPRYGDPVPHKTLFAYNAVTNSWSRRADMPHPILESMQAGLLGNLYVYAADGPDNYFLRYSPRLDKWTSLPLPTSEHSLGILAALNGKLYLTNGLTKHGSLNPELDVYDPLTRTWSVKQPMLRADGGSVAATFNGKLWVAGNEEALYSAKELEVYDPTTDEWKQGPLMLRTSREGAGAWAGGKFFVIGGTGDEGALTGVVQAFSTPY
jgi:N-acetylneuraminic acid mutarotase